MSGGGFILGGLLQGIGKGITDDVNERRRIALENLRADREQAITTLKEDRADARAATEGQRATERAIAVVKETGAQNRETTGVKTQGEIAKLGVEYKSKAALAQFTNSLEIFRDNNKSKLDTAREATIAKLKGEIEGGMVDTVTPLEDGSFNVTYKDGGTAKTGIIGRVDRNRSDEGGGSLAALRSGGSGGSTPAPAAAAPAAASATDGKPMLPRAKWDEYVAAAAAKASKGDPRFKGLSETQLKQKVRDMVIASGYAPPA